MKKVLVLGCTGSIGTSTLDICRNMKEKFSVCGLTANSKKEQLEKLSREFNCNVSLTSEAGTSGIEKLIDESKPDIVVNGIAGASGLVPSKIVLEKGIDLALANKETVVMAWPLIKNLADKNNAKIIPVDSEHSAIFNLINQAGKENVDEEIISYNDEMKIYYYKSNDAQYSSSMIWESKDKKITYSLTGDLTKAEFLKIIDGIKEKQ